MARSRRKREERSGNGKGVSRRKPDVPLDTNAEVLPAKTVATEGQSDTQVPGETKKNKLSGKKRKRLEKYIEKKLKREEADALIKKLSERVIDTSSLVSTKTLGQAKKTAAQPTSRKRKWDKDDSSTSMSEDSEDEDVERLSHNTVESSNIQEKTAEMPVIGAALKSGASKDFTERVTRPKKRQSKISWRQRLQDARKRPHEDNSDLSGSDSSLSSDSEFSSWSGFSSDEDEAVEEAHNGDINGHTEGSQDEDDPSDSEDEREQDADKRQRIDVIQRAKGFKEWAREQTGLGGSVSNITSLPVLPPGQRETLVSSAKGKMDDLEPPSRNKPPKQAYYVSVRRKPSIQESRLSLPIVGEEQQIMETLSEHDTLVICGETGSGKTTQIPQFLFEAGYGSPGSDRPGMIGITQPRRVAAVSMCTRVAEEVGSEHASRVGYQIRFDGNISAATAIKFMTDGVLLREVALDFLLTKYSAIIVDEAHERSVNTDVLIGVLSRVVKLRREMSTEQNSNVKPLKLIIMSATIRVTDFTANSRLFPKSPPVINVDARQFPVTIHFNRRTALVDYVNEAFKKIIKIHQRLPPGGILVFLTGQDEIRSLCKKLRERFPSKSKLALNMDDEDRPRVKCSAKDMDLEAEDVQVEQSLDDLVEDQLDDESDELSDSYDSDLERVIIDDTSPQATESPLHILPLYSLLPIDAQLRVFQPPPEGTRLCVAATNIAETSLTISGIKYVVDCGKVKERFYDKGTGVESFRIGWISKASAAQRAGRAGRTEPGHCYRLYSSTVFERDFAQFSEPEILKYPIEGIVLQMKGMRIDKVVNFPFPTPPDREGLRHAEKLLEYLGAVDKDHHITPLGESMSAFPLLPRYSKMIILGQQFENMPYIIAIVAGLSVGDPFLTFEEVANQTAAEEHGETTEAVESEALRSKRKKFFESREQFNALDPGCDVLRLLCVIGAYEAAGATDTFCEEHCLRTKFMKDIRRLRIQLSNLVNNQLSGIVAPVEFSANLAPPSAIQIRTLKQVVTAAYLDHIAIRSDLLDSDSAKRNAKDILRAEYTSLNTLARPANDETNSGGIFIHPNSALAMLSTAPDYIVYGELRESQSSGRLRLLPLTTVPARDIEPLARDTPLIQYSKPLNYPPPRLFSENSVSKREVYVVPRFGIQGKGWELPSIRRVENIMKS